MRILSNFDTKLAKNLCKEYEEMFGEDRVALIRRSKFFYYRYVGLPLFLYVTFVVIGAYLVYIPLGGTIRLQIVFRLIACIYGLILLGKLTYKYVDYKMDFLIVTPREVIKYDQSGVFSRYTEKIHADKIKTITITKRGLANSLFDMGTLVFLAEGDKDEGDIEMPYVDAIESTEKKMIHILGLDTLAGT